MRAETATEVRGPSAKRRELTQAIQLLKEGDTFVQEKATEILLAAKDRSVIKKLLPLLHEKDTGVRMTALEILKRIGHLDLSSIIPLVDYDNEDVQVYTCEIMASLKDPDTVGLLVRKSLENNDNVRTAAAIALGEFKSEEAVDALLRILGEDDWIVFSAIYSLGKIGNPKAIQPLMDVLRNREEEVSLAACEVLLGFRQEGILDEVFSILKAWNKEKRSPYIKIILEQGDYEVFVRLKDKIGEDLFEELLHGIKYEQKDSLKMMTLLAHFKSGEACNVILEKLKEMDPDDEDYSELLDVFVGLKEVWGWDPSKYLGKGKAYFLPMIQACVRAPIALDDDILLQVFRSAEQPVRREIITNVPVLVKGTGRELVAEAIRDADGHVKGGAILAAGQMGLEDLKGEIVESALKGFMDVRIKAVQVLSCVDKAEGIRIIEKFVHSGSVDDKKVYLSVADRLDGATNLPFLQKLVADEDEKVRYGAVRVVGTFLDEPAYMRMFTSLLDEENIPHEVLKVIRERRLAPFRDKLVSIFTHKEKGLWTRYYALLALGALEDPSLFDTFVSGLTDDNSLIKIGSLKALSDLGNKKAVRYARPFTHSPDEDVRSTAEFVLNRLECC